ncbi:MAG: hypothetical protein AAF514_22175, partial [Verrucomicrobiota bacterium]
MSDDDSSNRSDDSSNRSEWEPLLLARSTGTLTDRQRQRLETLVASDPDARKQYVDQLDTEALLQWQTGQIKPDLSQPSESTIEPLKSESTSRPPSARKPWLHAAIAACLLFGLGFFLLREWGPGPLRVTSTPPTESAPIERSVPQESLPPTPMMAADAAPDPVEPAEPPRTFRTGGWAVRPDAEARFEKTTETKLKLLAGVLHARAEAGAPPLEIETPAGTVTARRQVFVSTTLTNPESLPSQSSQTTLQPQADLPNQQPESTETMNRNQTLATYLTKCLIIAGTAVLMNGEGLAEGEENDVLSAESGKSPVKLQEEGNYREALDLFEKLLIDPEHKGAEAADHLKRALQCQRNLNRAGEFDSLVERVIDTHTGDWRVLWEAGRAYRRARHQGTLVGDEFTRGGYDRQGQFVQTSERDRTRALQLYAQAEASIPAIGTETDLDERQRFYLEWADQLAQPHEAWRLQILTNLSTLPDWNTPQFARGQGGAPVDANDQPLFHRRPASLE